MTNGGRRSDVANARWADGSPATALRVDSRCQRIDAGSREDPSVERGHFRGATVAAGRGAGQYVGGRHGAGGDVQHRGEMAFCGSDPSGRISMGAGRSRRVYRAALSLVAEGMHVPPMPERGLSPVLVLVSDGQPTDNFDEGLRRLLDTTWGSRAIRLAIAIGRDADQGVLQTFIGRESGQRPVLANNPDAIIAAIRWASTAVAPTFRETGSSIAVPGDDDLFYSPDDSVATP
jgi:hypothetical protein